MYGLYEPGATKPYYIGITDDLTRRRLEHVQSGRLTPGAKPRSLDQNITYGEARGYEQAYIEHYETKTGVIREEISAKNKGKSKFFDHSNATRAASRRAYFEDSYGDKTKSLKGGC